MRRLISAALVAAALLPGALLAQSIGPQGGTVWTVHPSPLPQRLYADSFGGAYRSDDGGVSWTRIDGGAFETEVSAVDTTDSLLVWAVSNIGRAYRSDDGGGHWNPVSLDLAAGERIVSVSPVAGGRGRARLGTTTGRILRSSGAAFSVELQAQCRAADSCQVVSIGSHPTDPNRLCIVANDGFGEGGILQCYQGGIPLFYGLSAVFRGDLTSVAMGRDGRACATFLQGGVACTDAGGGNEFHFLSDASLHVNAVAFDPADDSHVLLAAETGAFELRGEVRTTLFSGIPTIDPTPRDIEGVAFAADFAGSGRLWLGTAAYGVLTRASGDANWRAANGGLQASEVKFAAIDPRGLQRTVVGYHFNMRPQWPLQATTDGGASWQPSAFGSFDTVTGLEIDATTAIGSNPATVYAVGSVTGNVASYLFKSNDGGLDWFDIGGNLPVYAYGGRSLGVLNGLALDPRSCSAPPSQGPCTHGPLQTIIVSGTGDPNGLFRILRSNNGGQSWTDSSNGLPPVNLSAQSPERVEPRRMAVAAGDHTVLYLGTYYHGSASAQSQASGVFRSDDGGYSWQQRSDGLPSRASGSATKQDIFTVAVSPTHPEQVWASVVSRDWASTRVYASQDGGLSWSLRDDGLAGTDCFVFSLLVDDRYPGRRFAGGFDEKNYKACLYRSDDDGAHWNPMNTALLERAAGTLYRHPTHASAIVVGAANGLVVIDPPGDLIFSDGMGG